MVGLRAGLSISRQCKLLDVSRSSYYYQPTAESSLNLELMRLIDELYLQYPFYGSRQMRYHLRQLSHCVARKRIQRLMRKMGIVAIYPKPRTSIANKAHRIYPYLLRNLDINRANQVWCADISYIPTKYGFMYLVAIMDWYSRKVLTWRLSNTMDSLFCCQALQEALCIYGAPDIFNTDQGAQFTDQNWTAILTHANIKISMDGKGRWMDNVFVERLWRSLKYECVYLSEFENGVQARYAIGGWITFYNTVRPHSSFNGQTPHRVYQMSLGITENVHNLAA